MQKTDTMQAQIIIEQKKEIARLQKLIAKIEVKKDSEIARLKAQLSEEKKNKTNIVINRSGKNL